MSSAITKKDLSIYRGTYDEVMRQPTQNMTIYLAWDTNEIFVGNAHGVKTPYNGNRITEKTINTALTDAYNQMKAYIDDKGLEGILQTKWENIFVPKMNASFETLKSSLLTDTIQPMVDNVNSSIAKVQSDLTTFNTSINTRITAVDTKFTTITNTITSNLTETNRNLRDNYLLKSDLTDTLINEYHLTKVDSSGKIYLEGYTNTATLEANYLKIAAFDSKIADYIKTVDAQTNLDTAISTLKTNITETYTGKTIQAIAGSDLATQTKTGLYIISDETDPASYKGDIYNISADNASPVLLSSIGKAITKNITLSLSEVQNSGRTIYVDDGKTMQNANLAITITGLSSYTEGKAMIKTLDLHYQYTGNDGTLGTEIIINLLTGTNSLESSVISNNILMINRTINNLALNGSTKVWVTLSLISNTKKISYTVNNKNLINDNSISLTYSYSIMPTVVINELPTTKPNLTDGTILTGSDPNTKFLSITTSTDGYIWLILSKYRTEIPLYASSLETYSVFSSNKFIYANSLLGLADTDDYKYYRTTDELSSGKYYILY
jgi:hypothetical protein